MEFKFDAGQEFQTKAIESVVRLFQGQQKIEIATKYVLGAGFIGSPNRLDLTEEELMTNLREAQGRDGLNPDRELDCIEQTIETADGRKSVRFPNFSVEMETGTGKTYVYIRTALELHQRFGFRRFIIVVPSIAVKEGVLKTFQITQKHFQELYDKTPYKFYEYDSSNLTQVRQFCSSPNLEFMIMTLDSFNKSMTEENKGNVILRPTDRLQGATPVHLVQASKPILILDEPQNMESEKSIQALATLDPLCALRYSATHRNPYNLVYRLTPAEAYLQGLVKKIEVAGVQKADEANRAFIHLGKITARKNTVTASLIVNRLMKTGSVKQKSVTIRPGIKLVDKTNLPEYSGFEVEEINPGSNIVLFTNGIELRVGESHGADKEAIFEAQIRYAVEEHIRKQRRLRDRGIKVLSLFFIDKVDNYTSDRGLIKHLFNKVFLELKDNVPEWAEVTAEEVQAAYFSFTKKKEEILYEDSTGRSQRDQEAYDLIMKDKERLLSFETRVAFIFSHSALREGWDNPNVFQICTLNQTSSEIKKRQEIGRGIRLAVNQDGERVHDPEVNLLTVVANQSYESYVSQLQVELEEDYGEKERPPLPPNARKRLDVHLRKEYVLKPEFQTLWERIRDKTRYYVTIDTESVINECAAAVNEREIKRPRITVTKARIDVNDKNAFEALQLTSARTFTDLSGRFPLPNLLDTISHLLENTTPPVKLSKKTLLEIFLRSRDKQAALDNPFEYASVVSQVLKEKLAEFLVRGIKYEKTGDWYEMSLLEESFETWEDYTVPANRSVYDRVQFDSNVERQFIEGLEKVPQVRMYVKLPNWFTVRTPVGLYNPDWAIVWEDRDEHGHVRKGPLMYIVRETKGTKDISRLRDEERRKVVCAMEHFNKTLGTSYKIVESIKDLP